MKCTVSLLRHCQHSAYNAYNFATSGSNVTKLFHATYREAGVFKRALFWGNSHPLKFGMVKFGAISDNFRLWSPISPERIDLSKIGKVLDQLQPFLRSAKKTWWTLVHKEKSLGRACWPTQTAFFRETIFRPLGGAGPSNFNTHYRLTKAC